MPTIVKNEKQQEGKTMIDYTSLNKKVKDSGMTKAFIAKKLGITRASLYDKLSGKRSFDAAEIGTLKEVLHLDDESFLAVFFNSNVGKMPTIEVVNG